jgi:hypothetical protein
MQPKIGQFALENDLGENALIKAGMLSEKSGLPRRTYLFLVMK